MSNDCPGARHLSAKAKKLWSEGTSESNLPHFRGVCYNLIHTYCYFLCSEGSCDGCKVADVRSWMSSLKTLPKKGDVPTIRELDVEGLAKEEAKGVNYEVDLNGPEPEAD